MATSLIDPGTDAADAGPFELAADASVTLLLTGEGGQIQIQWQGSDGAWRVIGALSSMAQPAVTFDGPVAAWRVVRVAQAVTAGVDQQ